MRVFFTAAPLAALCLLSACGDLPRPFMGRPGAEGARLSRPPPARLAILPPTAALLDNAAGSAFAGAIADALLDETIPAVAGAAKNGDWRLETTAEMKGSDVIPTFTVFNPSGATQGSTDGKPVPASAWAAGDVAAFKTEAQTAAPEISALLTGIQAKIQQDDPNSLVNRPAKIQLIGVTGAPGDGNAALARTVRTDLSDLGFLVQDAAAGSDYTLRCEIKVVPVEAGNIRVEIQWIVDQTGAGERGRIVQVNEVSPTAITPYWGDVAIVVAQQAAGGVREVILNQIAAHKLGSDKNARTKPDTAPPDAAAAPPAQAPP